MNTVARTNLAELLDCASPLALFQRGERKEIREGVWQAGISSQSGRGLPQSKTSRTFGGGM